MYFAFDAAELRSVIISSYIISGTSSDGSLVVQLPFSTDHSYEYKSLNSYGTSVIQSDSFAFTGISVVPVIIYITANSFEVITDVWDPFSMGTLKT